SIDLLYYFFFSSRRRHTRSDRDWSSDVCSSDLPKVYDLDELLKLSPLEERIYRLRCVEGWSMVIPWVGYSLAELIKRVEPMGNRSEERRVGKECGTRWAVVWLSR